MLLAQVAADRAQGTPPVLLTPGYGLTPDDFPPAAWALQQEGRAVARMLLDEHGAIASCDIVTSSGSAALDAGTCPALRRRARFAPARDASGQARAVWYRAPVSWLIPMDRGERLISQSLVVMAEFGPDLIIRQCSASVGGYELTLAASDCPRYSYLFPYADLMAASGQGAHGVRGAAEQRREYAGSSLPPPPALPGRIVFRHRYTFRIDARGQANGCVMTDRIGLARDGRSPCDAGWRFDLGEIPDAAYPISASWTITVALTPLP